VLLLIGAIFRRFKSDRDEIRQDCSSMPATVSECDTELDTVLQPIRFIVMSTLSSQHCPCQTNAEMEIIN